MASAPKDFSKGVKLPALDGKGLKVGIVRTRWNDGVVSKLEQGCLEALADCGVSKDNVITTFVPGSFEVWAALVRARST